MVDEYQDTNTAQFELIVFSRRQIQKPVQWSVMTISRSPQVPRSGNIYNILNFEAFSGYGYHQAGTELPFDAEHPKHGEQCDCTNNVRQKGKNRSGRQTARKKIDFEQFDTAYEEADYVAKDIASGVRDEVPVTATTRCSTARYASPVCLRSVLSCPISRTRLSRQQFLCIPRSGSAGVLKTIDNARDDLAVRRIINVPKRGIGATTLNRVSGARRRTTSVFMVLQRAEEIPSLGKSATKNQPFVTLSRRCSKPLYRWWRICSEVIEGDGL